MKLKELYRYRRSDGGITISLDKPEATRFEITNRLIADEGKMLTLDGNTLYPCVDVDIIAGWYEVEAPAEELIWEV